MRSERGAFALSLGRGHITRRLHGWNDSTQVVPAVTGQVRRRRSGSSRTLHARDRQIGKAPRRAMEPGGTPPQACPESNLVPRRGIKTSRRAPVQNSHKWMSARPHRWCLGEPDGLKTGKPNLFPFFFLVLSFVLLLSSAPFPLCPGSRRLPSLQRPHGIFTPCPQRPVNFATTKAKQTRTQLHAKT